MMPPTQTISANQANVPITESDEALAALVGDLSPLLLALTLRPVPFPAWSVTVLEKLGGTLAPLALVSVGFQLRFAGMRGEARPLAAGLVFKLFAGPALLTLLYVTILGVTGTGQTALLGGVLFAIAPLLSAFSSPVWGVVADRYGRKRMVQRALAVSVGAYTLMAMATSIWHVVALRAVIGIFGGFYSMSLAYLMAVTPASKASFQVLSSSRRQIEK